MPERRSELDVATRRILGAVHEMRPATLASRTVDVGSARVRLLVRTDGGVTRVVAVCAAADRERVARALAGARFALAGAGIVVAA